MECNSWLDEIVSKKAEDLSAKTKGYHKRLRVF